MDSSKIPNKPTIFVANYPCNYIEYLTHGLFGEKVCLLVHDAAIKVLQFVHGMPSLLPVRKGGFDKLQEQVREKLKEGYHIFAYIEKDYYNRKSKYKLAELHSGMFAMAKNLGTTVTPMAIDHIDHTMGMIGNAEFHIKIGDSFHVTSVPEAMNTTKEFLRRSLNKMAIKRSS